MERPAGGEDGGVSTRKLIVLAFLCGMAILIAGAWQFFQIIRTAR